MVLRAVDGPAGPPWERPLAGRFDALVIESELLAANPLGDPARRPLYVYCSPGVAAGTATSVPAVYMLQGYGAQVDTWRARRTFEPTFVERLDALCAAGDCPEGVVVMLDAWTSLGGSQFLNSSSTGRYLDYICDEIVPFVDGRYPTAAARDHRGVAGHSSGGYGAMVLPMLRPDVFAALASHAGDALFECCYLPEFPAIVRTLRDHFEGSYEALVDQALTADPFDWGRFGRGLSNYAYATAYSPDPDRPGRALLPFDPGSGRLVAAVWERWLAWDPVRMAPDHGQELRSLRRIYLDAGRADEYFLDLGTQAFAAELDRVGAAYTLELFDGKHGGIGYRYPLAVRALLTALQR